MPAREQRFFVSAATAPSLVQSPAVLLPPAMGSGQFPMNSAIGSGQLPMRPSTGSGQLPMRREAAGNEA
jgi:hypothetical protein